VKTLLYIFFATTLLFARYEAKPSKECEAFNNMKHTKNSHNVILDREKKYTVLRSHKGQKLIMVKGENPSQRWVDESCFEKEQAIEHESMEEMEAELARLEQEMYAELGLDKKNTHQTREKRSKSIMSMQKELASLENKMNKRLKVDNKRSYVSKQNILALSWHNAFCEMHRYKKECKRGIGSLLGLRDNESQFVLHGLWPQPRNNIYCNVDKKTIALDKKKRWRDLPSLELDKELEKELSIAMPGYTSSLHLHEWIKHGTCYGLDANSYYSRAISLLKQFNRSSLAAFFKVKQGERVTLRQIKKIAQKEFGKGAAKSIAIQCKKGLITEVWLQLGSGSDELATLLKKGKKLYSRCKSGRIDETGFSKKTLKGSFGR
jgi:ribonuclease T2